MPPNQQKNTHDFRKVMGVVFSLTFTLFAVSFTCLVYRLLYGPETDPKHLKEFDRMLASLKSELESGAIAEEAWKAAHNVIMERKEEVSGTIMININILMFATYNFIFMMTTGQHLF